MKNCELSVRTLDEGAMDEQSGMNFAEYIAILSGDTSLLEKTRVEKKVAVLEGYRASHYKEVARSRYRLEDLEKGKVDTKATLDLMLTDEIAYKKLLKHDQEGAKLNLVQLDSFKEVDPVAIGNHFIDLYKRWSPESYKQPELKIGTLYGFDLYIRRKFTTVSSGISSEMDFVTTLFAESPVTGIKYMQNNGAPNVDNPKTAARYFINAIDRVAQLVEKYRKQLNEIEKEIPDVRALTQKTFEGEAELAALKIEQAKLEEQINLNILEQQKPAETVDLFPEDEAVEQIVYSAPKR